MRRAIWALGILVAAILIVGLIGHVLPYAIIGGGAFVAGVGYGRTSAALGYRRRRKDVLGRKTNSRLLS